MMHLAIPLMIAAVLVGIGIYGVLARRHAVMLLLAVELVLAGVGLMLVSLDSALAVEGAQGQVLTLFIIAIAAAEVVVAIGVFVAVYRTRGNVDLAAPAERSVGAGERDEVSP